MVLLGNARGTPSPPRRQPETEKRHPGQRTIRVPGRTPCLWRAPSSSPRQKGYCAHPPIEPAPLLSALDIAPFGRTTLLRSVLPDWLPNRLPSIAPDVASALLRRNCL